MEIARMTLQLRDRHTDQRYSVINVYHGHSSFPVKPGIVRRCDFYGAVAKSSEGLPLAMRLTDPDAKQQINVGWRAHDVPPEITKSASRRLC